MPLSETAVRNAKPAQKPSKLFDERGLFLLVTPTGGKWWRLKYRFAGKEKLLSLGTYPDVSLKKARAKRDEARSLVSDGIDPSAAKQEKKAEQTAAVENAFETVAREWFGKWGAGKAKNHSTKVIRRLERDVFPYLGARAVSEIKAPDILTVARRIENRNAIETAHRAIQNIGQVIRYAIATGRAEADPTTALRGALTPWKPQHMAAPSEPVQVGALLRAIEEARCGPVVTAALRLLPLVFVRPGELRTMRWEHVDLKAKEWRYTTSKTKTEHLVPLSTQAIAVLEDLRLLTGHLPGGWVFPGGRSPKNPLSNAAINAAYRRLGIDTRTELTGHGWRAVARTLLHERLKYAPEIIEHQLAHAVPDKLGKAYNRTRFVEERHQMMQAWADYLDDLRRGADIVPIRKKA